MNHLSSKFAFLAAGAAALALATTPAEAHGWGHYHHDHDGIGFGDVVAGALVIGGIAAIASAANNSHHDTDRYDYPPPPPPPARYDDDDGYDYAPPPAQGYREGYAPPAPGYRASGISGAVDACTGEVERGRSHVASVDNAVRTADGWHVSGQLSQGGGFDCSVGNDGHVRNVNTGGDNYSAYNDAAPQDRQWSDEAYASAREQADADGSYDPPAGDPAYAN